MNVFPRFVVMLSIVLALLLVFQLIAVQTIDPYGLIGSRVVTGFNRIKPASYRYAEAAKRLRMSRMEPRTIIFGNSRVDAGWDPKADFWPESMRPVFNAGVPGQGFYQLARQIEDALVRTIPPRIIFIGVDVIDMVTTCKHSATLAAFSHPSFVQTHLSITALIDLIKTLVAQADPYARTMRPDGFNPWRDIEATFRREGPAQVIAHKNRRTVEQLSSLPRKTSCELGKSKWDRLQAVIAKANDQNVRVVLFTHPVHADFIMILSALGFERALLETKQRMVELAKAFRNSSAIDLAVLDHRTTELAPTRMIGRQIYYYEPSHYRPALIAEVLPRYLERLLSYHRSSPASEVIEGQNPTTLSIFRYREKNPKQWARIKAIVARTE